MNRETYSASKETSLISAISPSKHSSPTHLARIRTPANPFQMMMLLDCVPTQCFDCRACALSIIFVNIQHPQDKQIQMYGGPGQQANLIAGGRSLKHAYRREQGPSITNNRHYAEKEPASPSSINRRQDQRHERNNIDLSTRHEEDALFPFDFKYVYENGEESEEFDAEDLNQNQLFQIDGCKFSPIANTYIEDNDPPIKDRLSNGSILPYKPRLQSRVRGSNPQSQRWRDFLNPDVNKFYELLMKSQENIKESRQKNVQTPRKQSLHHSHEVEHEGGKNGDDYGDCKKERSESNHPQPRGQKCSNLSVGNEAVKETRNKSTMQNEQDTPDAEELKRKYEEKISVLEHQNTNLKDELFYLRAAILAQYEAREQAKTPQKVLK